MTYEDIPAAQQPNVAEDSPEAFSGLAFMTERGMESIAGFEMEAHGVKITLAQAIELCPPLVGMVESLYTNLKDVPGHEDIIKNALVSASVSTAERELSNEAKKKLKN